MEKKNLSFARLQATLTDYNKKQRNKSVVSPTAQYVTKLHKDNQVIDRLTSICTNLLESSNVPDVVKAVASLQMAYGLRISEVLNINISDISKSGHIRVKGLKGSSTRVIVPLFMRDFWSVRNKHLFPLVSVYSRHYFYRWYKRLGILINFGIDKKQAVTHAFRHVVVSSISNDFHDSTLTQSFIGHKQIKSTKHYENKGKSSQ
jgi:site-specific recombinase XerD